MAHKHQLITIPDPPDKPYGSNRVRVGTYEYKALCNLAEYEDVSLSEATRLAIREAARVRGIWPLKEALPAQDPPDKR